MLTYSYYGFVSYDLELPKAPKTITFYGLSLPWMQTSTAFSHETSQSWDYPF